MEIGDGCFFNNYCSINAKAGIKIGANCLFGENVKIYDHDHDYKNNIYDFVRKRIEIGSNTWIASNCIILKGVNIGSRCVIAAGTIVNKNINSNNLIYQVKQIENKEILV